MAQSFPVGISHSNPALLDKLTRIASSCEGLYDAPLKYTTMPIRSMSDSSNTPTWNGTVFIPVALMFSRIVAPPHHGLRMSQIHLG
jgi:hypothetical protein